MALVPETLRDFSGGTNLRDAPLGLGPADCVLLENMIPLAGGGAIGRGGQTEYNATEIDGNAIKSLYRFYKQNGTALLLATSGTKVYKGDDGAGSFTEIDSGYTAAQRFGFTSWSAKDKSYWINDVEVLKSYDGTTVATVGGTPPVGPMVEFHKDRLWILQANLIRFSELNVDNVWPALSAINVADNKGGFGTWIKSANGLLIIGKTTGLWRFEGSPLLGGELVQFSGVPCVAPWTARVVNTIISGQVIPVAVAFLGADGVYLTDGYSVDSISGKIDPLFTDQFTGAVGEYYPKRQQYWLSFNAAGGANDTTVVATKLDTAEGSRVAWSPYTGFAIDSFAVWDGPGDSGEIYAGRSDGGKVRRLDFGVQDVGVDYQCKLTTRNLDFGDSGVNKSVRWLKAVFKAQQPVSYIISYLTREQTSASIDARARSTAKWNTAKWNQAQWVGSVFSNSRTSTLFSGYGRFLNVSLFNRGDGSGFEVYELDVEARTKNSRTFDLFTLYDDAQVGG